MMAKKKAKRGGARVGAGRPVGSKNSAPRSADTLKVRVNYRLAPEVVSILAAVAATGKMSRAAAIEYAVNKVFGSVFGPGAG